MTERVYIDGLLMPGAGKATVLQAMRAGRSVVVVDGASVPMQLTEKLLKGKKRRARK